MIENGRDGVGKSARGKTAKQEQACTEPRSVLQAGKGTDEKEPVRSENSRRYLSKVR